MSREIWSALRKTGIVRSCIMISECNVFAQCHGVTHGTSSTLTHSHRTSLPCAAPRSCLHSDKHLLVLERSIAGCYSSCSWPRRGRHVHVPHVTMKSETVARTSHFTSCVKRHTPNSQLALPRHRLTGKGTCGRVALAQLVPWSRRDSYCTCAALARITAGREAVPCKIHPTRKRAKIDAKSQAFFGTP